jgi:hypothetical protein
MLSVLTTVALAIIPAGAFAQGYPPAGYAPGPYGPMPMFDPSVAMYAPPGMAVGYMQPGSAPPSVLAAGQPMPMGATPMGPAPGSPAEAFAEDWGSGYCPHCGGIGCPACGHHGLLGGLFGWLVPEGDGGCCAMRWYDLSVDFMLLTRDDAGRDIPISSEGIGGPIVLSTGDLDFDEAPSFRFSGQFQITAGGSIEFTYYGLFNFDSFARVTSDGNLFSALSQFGQLPFGGFPNESDAADVHRIEYSSTFDNFEVNFRRRWMAPNCRYQGSWLAGARYFKLDEDFEFTSITPTGGLDMDVQTNNSLTGFQLGGDLWICVVPGLRVGGELKAGIFGNHAIQSTAMAAPSFGLPYAEEVKSDDVAFVTNLDLMLLYRLNYIWTLRAGYQFLFVDGVALASENFNPTPPSIFAGLPPNVIRTPTINDNGNVFYHGWMVGLEFMW